MPKLIIAAFFALLLFILYMGTQGASKPVHGSLVERPYVAVAACDAPASVKLGADYVATCEHSDDAIRSALDSASCLQSCTIMLSKGTFKISAPGVSTDINGERNITIEGQGQATNVVLHNPNGVTGGNNYGFNFQWTCDCGQVTIGGFALKAAPAEGKDVGSGLAFWQFGGSTPVNRLHLHDIVVYSSWQAGPIQWSIVIHSLYGSILDRISARPGVGAYTGSAPILVDTEASGTRVNDYNGVGGELRVTGRENIVDSPFLTGGGRILVGESGAGTIINNPVLKGPSTLAFWNSSGEPTHIYGGAMTRTMEGKPNVTFGTPAGNLSGAVFHGTVMATGGFVTVNLSATQNMAILAFEGVKFVTQGIGTIESYPVHVQGAGTLGILRFRDVSIDGTNETYGLAEVINGANVDDMQVIGLDARNTNGRGWPLFVAQYGGTIDRLYTRQIRARNDSGTQVLFAGPIAASDRQDEVLVGMMP